MLTAGDYLEGAALLAAMLGGTVGGSLLLFRRRLPWLRGVEALCAFGVVAACGVLAVHLVPAGLGILSRGTVLVTTGLWLVACRLVPPSKADREDLAGVSAPTGEPPAPRVLGLATLALTVVFFLAFARGQFVATSGSIDFASFHLPDVSAGSRRARSGRWTASCRRSPPGTTRTTAT